MPRTRTLKSIAIQSTIFVVLVSILGHFTVNFWERYIIQSELLQMRDSLHSLKKTLFSIGNEYDKLHRDLKGLADLAEKKISPLTYHKAPEHSCTTKYTLDRRAHHDIEVRAVIDAKKKGSGFHHVKDVNDKTAIDKLLQNKINYASNDDTTTNNVLIHSETKNITKLDIRTNDKLINNETTRIVKDDKTTNDEVLKNKTTKHSVKEDKTTNDNLYSYETKYTMPEPPAEIVINKDMTTMTRYPLKSTGVGERNKDSDRNKKSKVLSNACYECNRYREFHKF